MIATQTKHLGRVRLRIGKAVELFVNSRDLFLSEELREFIIRYTGSLAPASADRVLRDLRQRRIINYKVQDRARGLYRTLPVDDLFS